MRLTKRGKAAAHTHEIDETHDVAPFGVTEGVEIAAHTFSESRQETVAASSLPQPECAAIRLPSNAEIGCGTVRS